MGKVRRQKVGSRHISLWLCAACAMSCLSSPAGLHGFLLAPQFSPGSRAQKMNDVLQIHPHTHSSPCPLLISVAGEKTGQMSAAITYAKQLISSGCSLHVGCANEEERDCTLHSLATSWVWVDLFLFSFLSLMQVSCPPFYVSEFLDLLKLRCYGACKH